MLTPEQVQRLTARFAPDEHEFRKAGRDTLTYLTEAAVTARLDEVDPCWSFEVTRVDTRELTVNVYARMTVGGVSRESVGSDRTKFAKDAEQTAENETNEPEKSALTDALKRCARLFGIGRYLLTCPKWVNSETNLRKWFAETGSPAPATPNPFGDEAAQTAITAALKAHGLDSENGKAFVLSNLLAGRTFAKFSDTHPTLTPQDVLKAIPVLGPRYKIGSKPRREEAETDPGTPPFESARRTTASGSTFTPSSTTRSPKSTAGSATQRTTEPPFEQLFGETSKVRLGRPGSAILGRTNADARSPFRKVSPSGSSGTTDGDSSSSTSQTTATSTNSQRGSGNER